MNYSVVRTDEFVTENWNVQWMFVRRDATPFTLVTKKEFIYL